MMLRQTKHSTANRGTLAACALAMAAAVMVAAPTSTNAHEPSKSDATPMAAEHDHQKMKGMSMTGDVDYDFAANMRKHHQMAIDRSQAELANGQNPQMVQMAKDIIAAQTKEIAVLDKWMEAHKNATTKGMPKSQ